MRVAVLALALLAMPWGVQAQEACLAGMPKRVTYDDGRIATIIQRHGEDVTYTVPYVGGNDVVSKTHLVLFPKQTRMATRFLEYKWESRLPKLSELVPGFHYDVAGEMKSGDAPPQDYRMVGDVTEADVVKIGDCDYPVVVIATKTLIGGVEVVSSTLRLSTEMVAVLQSEAVDAAGKKTASRAVGLE